ncbi:hypothetical protein, partial [Mycolicibacterium insubricum]|uniref:hypothetical protein n=1 Tax=Mycolicibacterium insubricum TaxID=444597 RepID=UPI0021F3BDF2
SSRPTHCQGAASIRAASSRRCATERHAPLIGAPPVTGATDQGISALRRARSSASGTPRHAYGCSAIK